MANVPSVYDPVYYANEALLRLKNSLGMANRVYRGYEKEPRSRGSVISIRVPGTFTAQDAPSAAQDIEADEVQIILDKWREVKFKLSDKEDTLYDPRIISEHLDQAAIELADDLDRTLCGLYRDIPWYEDVEASAAITDILAARKILLDNKAPQNDLHMMIDTDMEADLLSLSAFAQHQGAGPQGVQTQMRGSLGVKYGFEIFVNQNVRSHQKGTASTGTLAINNATGYNKGATQINLDAATVTGTLVPGDSFVIAGHSQRYVVQNTVTASGNAFNGVKIFPALAEDVTDDAVVTVSLDNHSACLAFHRQAFALAMAPLSDRAKNLGAQVATVTDPITGISLRSRVYYVGNSSEVHVALDMLYGVKTLNPNLAVRLRN